MDTVEDALLAFRHSAPRDLEDRIERLAVEWDVDRASALALAILGLLTVPLARVRGGWIVPAALQALALLRFLGIGPDPIGRLLRPFGFRPRVEIETEAGVVRALHRRTPSPREAPEPTPTSGEELRPMDAPTVSGPSGEWPPRGGLR